MNQELHEKLEKFLKEKNCQSIEDANKALQEFIELNNCGKIEYEESDLVKAYNLLEKAESSKTEKEAIEYAEKALEVCSYCLDAKLFLASLKENPMEALMLIEKAVQEEKDRLTKEKFFTKDDIGRFYGIFETRPYIRGLSSLAHLYKDLGMIKTAIKTCSEIIRLNNNDNTGARYLLMGLYVYMEDEGEMKKLIKKYPQECLSFLVPFMLFYYKKRDFKKAKEYLDKINKYNKHFTAFFKGNMEKTEGIEGYYRYQDPSEVLMVLEELDFLFDSVYGLDDFILNEGKI